MGSQDLARVVFSFRAFSMFFRYHHFSYFKVGKEVAVASPRSKVGERALRCSWRNEALGEHLVQLSGVSEKPVRGRIRSPFVFGRFCSEHVATACVEMQTGLA